MSAADPPRIVAAGDAAMLVVYGRTIDTAANARVHALGRHLLAVHGDDTRWGRPVPGYASLLVPYDPLRLTDAEARAAVTEAVADVEASAGHDASPSAGPAVAGASIIEIPVRYGGPDGPDLPEVARRLGLDELEVVHLHAEPTYQVFMLGFSPGFPYLGPLPQSLVLPRRSTPRTVVPAGSVAIAGNQTGIYPTATPGGWHLIGRTDLRLWDPEQRPPARLAPGDRVRFVPER